MRARKGTKAYILPHNFRSKYLKRKPKIYSRHRKPLGNESNGTVNTMRGTRCIG